MTDDQQNQPQAQPQQPVKQSQKPQQTVQNTQSPQQTSQATSSVTPKYLRLADAIKTSKQPAAYYRHFIAAAASGQIKGAIMLADTIKIAPARKGGKTKEVRDYAILQGSGFTEWSKAELAAEASKITGKSAPTFAELAAGQVDIKTAQESTAKLLQRQIRKPKVGTVQ